MFTVHRSRSEKNLVAAKVNFSSFVIIKNCNIVLLYICFVIYTTFCVFELLVHLFIFLDWIAKISSVKSSVLTASFTILMMILMMRGFSNVSCGFFSRCT